MSKLKPAIFHGTFVKWLSEILLDNKPLPACLIQDIITKTSGGVAPEGATSAVLTILDSYDVYNPDRFIGVPPIGEAPVNLESIKPEPQSGFRFGKASLKELEGVKPELVKVVELAIQYTKQDFCVYDGIRTWKEQAEYLRRGTTKTMKSKHLDGLAVDLVPWIGGRPVWDWEGCYEIARAMDEAATEFRVANHIRWGGAWDRVLSDFAGDSITYRRVVDDYQARHHSKDFIDGPHFEWVD